MARSGAAPLGSHPDPDDADLLGSAAAGDEHAFETLLGRYSSAAYGLALRVARDPEMARDITQEAFLQMWSQAARFDPSQGSVRAWIFTLVHRRAVDRVRAEQAGTRRELRTVGSAYEPPHDQVSAQVERLFEIRRVRSALAGLTDIQREAIDLAYYRGYTHVEVAAALDIPVGTAKTRLRDGLIRLRDTLG